MNEQIEVGKFYKVNDTVSHAVYVKIRIVGTETISVNGLALSNPEFSYIENHIVKKDDIKTLTEIPESEYIEKLKEVQQIIDGLI